MGVEARQQVAHGAALRNRLQRVLARPPLVMGQGAAGGGDRGVVAGRNCQCPTQGALDELNQPRQDAIGIAGQEDVHVVDIDQRRSEREAAKPRNPRQLAPDHLLLRRPEARGGPFRRRRPGGWSRLGHSESGPGSGGGGEGGGGGVRGNAANDPASPSRQGRAVCREGQQEVHRLQAIALFAIIMRSCVMIMHRRPPDDTESYDLEGEAPPGPPLPGSVVVAGGVDEIVDLLAAEVVVQSLACMRRFGDFHLALSGGSTPQPLYERLMYDADCRRLPWPRTHLWMVDERVVGFDDPRSNFGKIHETIVEHSDIPREQVHPIPVQAPAADAEYERAIREVLEWRGPGEDRLDFVLLGMGADGHTASLFPGSEVLAETTRLVRAVTVPPGIHADPPQRVTMTYPLINAARLVAVLVTGAAKAATVQRVATGRDPREVLPIKGVRPERGELRWFLDREAAGIRVAR